MHQFTDSLTLKLEKINIQKKIKNLFTKTGVFKINLPNLNKQTKINKKIKKLKYNCIENMLNLNDDLKK